MNWESPDDKYQEEAASDSSLQYKAGMLDKKKTESGNQ